LELPVERYLTTEEFAEIARTAPSTVRYWRHVGKGPAGVRRGRRVLYPESAVEQWMSGEDQAVRGAAVA
jgi:predicted site-specific integrase-resolvase